MHVDKRRKPLSQLASTTNPIEGTRKGVPDRLYGLPELQEMLRMVMRGSSLKVAANSCGFPSAASSLQRYAKAIKGDASLVRDSEEATLAMRLQQVNAATSCSHQYYDSTAQGEGARRWDHSGCSGDEAAAVSHSGPCLDCNAT